MIYLKLVLYRMNQPWWMCITILPLGLRDWLKATDRSRDKHRRVKVKSGVDHQTEEGSTPNVIVDIP